MEHKEMRKENVDTQGYTSISSIYTQEEIDALITLIGSANSESATFRRSTELFAIRQFFKAVPQAASVVFNQKLREVIHSLFGEKYFAVKSIYFDKPGSSNWFVSYHQDLTISVKERVEIEGFGPWSVKEGQYAVQPPPEILEQNFTVRIHIDDTDETNGALRVIPGSHLKGIYRPEMIDWTIEREITCSVPKGGIMIMRPLLLHASSRSTSDRKRRVLHIEFACSELPELLQWSERLPWSLLPS